MFGWLSGRPIPFGQTKQTLSNKVAVPGALVGDAIRREYLIVRRGGMLHRRIRPQPRAVAVGLSFGHRGRAEWEQGDDIHRKREIVRLFT